MHRFLAATFLAGLFVMGGACADSDGGTPDRERQQISITLSDMGCSPIDISVDEGPVRFFVSNPRSSTVTAFEVLDGRRTVASVTNVLGGISRSGDAELSPGTYTTRCQSGSTGGIGVLTVRDVP